MRVGLDLNRWSDGSALGRTAVLTITKPAAANAQRVNAGIMGLPVTLINQATKYGPPPPPEEQGRQRDSGVTVGAELVIFDERAESGSRRCLLRVALV